ncbi:uncharacterized protein RCH25_006718 [Pelodytes ibericus]
MIDRQCFLLIGHDKNIKPVWLLKENCSLYRSFLDYSTDRLGWKVWRERQQSAEGNSLANATNVSGASSLTTHTISSGSTMEKGCGPKLRHTTEANMWIYQSVILWFCLWECDAEFCPPLCDCRPIERKGLDVDCSHRKLKALPELPENTIKLHLQSNSLTSVPTGIFDPLMNLEMVDLSDNPWSCDCNFFYLKVWLESNEDLVINFANVRCATPASISQVPFQNLSGNEFQDCKKRWPIHCEGFFVRDLYLIGLAVSLLIMMSYAYRISKRLACYVTMYSTGGSRHKTCTKDSHKSK